MTTEKEWAEWGKKIYDTAMKNFIDKPVKNVIIPLKDKDGCLTSVTFSHPLIFVQVSGPPEKRRFEHFYKLSTGELVHSSKFDNPSGE